MTSGTAYIRAMHVDQHPASWVLEFSDLREERGIASQGTTPLEHLKKQLLSSSRNLIIAENPSTPEISRQTSIALI